MSRFLMVAFRQNRIQLLVGGISKRVVVAETVVEVDSGQVGLRWTAPEVVKLLLLRLGVTAGTALMPEVVPHGYVAWREGTGLLQGLPCVVGCRHQRTYRYHCDRV